LKPVETGWIRTLGPSQIRLQLTNRRKLTLKVLQKKGTDHLRPKSYSDLFGKRGAGHGTSIWNQTFNYDAFGNIAKTVPTGSTGVAFQAVYSGSTNRLTSISTFTPTYDNNGNLKYDTVHNLTWDSDANMITVDSTAVQVTYDAFDRAVEQNRGGTYTQIVYAPFGGKLALMNGTTLVKAFVALPGGPTAVYAPGTTGPIYYRHADWLGSSRLASTQSRTKYFDVSYAPFGENYNNSGTTDYNFTGQNQDTVSGYDDFLFREHSPVQSRWLSPDPAGMAAVDPTNPQSWNRYAYVLNNPLLLIDPLGLDEGPVCGYTYNHNVPVWVCAETFGGGDGAGGGGDSDGGLPPSMWPNNPTWTGVCAAEYSSCTYYLDGTVVGNTGDGQGYIFYLTPCEDSATGWCHAWAEIVTDIMPTPANTGNCQPPFLCNTGTGPQKTIGPPPPPKPLPHVNRAACMIASLIGNAFGNDDKTFATLGLNVAAYAKYFGPAIGLELPGPGWVYAAVAGTYDLGVLGVTYLECKE
jgi:RHS repeat-associated protein